MHSGTAPRGGAPSILGYLGHWGWGWGCKSRWMGGDQEKTEPPPWKPLWLQGSPASTVTESLNFRLPLWACTLQLL